MGNRSGALGTESRPEPAQNQVQDAPTAVPSKSTSNFSAASHTQECDMLHPLMSNWPCIVTTVLGFYPEEEIQPQPVMDGSVSSSPSCAGKLLPVHLLDSFTTDLVLNCEDSLINKLVAVIVKKMNEAFENSDDNVSSKVLLETLSIQDCRMSELAGPTRAVCREAVPEFGDAGSRSGTQSGEERPSRAAAGEDGRGWDGGWGWWAGSWRKQ